MVSTWWPFIDYLYSAGQKRNFRKPVVWDQDSQYLNNDRKLPWFQLLGIFVLLGIFDLIFILGTLNYETSHVICALLKA